MAKFPKVRVKLSGTDGNAFCIMGKVRKALKDAGHADQVEAFTAEAQSRDYDHLLQTCMNWVSVS